MSDICKHDTDGDGDCPEHKTGCAREIIAELERRVKSLLSPSHWGQTKNDLQAEAARQKKLRQKAEAKVKELEAALHLPGQQCGWEPAWLKEKELRVAAEAELARLQWESVTMKQAYRQSLEREARKDVAIDLAVNLRCAADRVIASPRTWRELIEPAKNLADALRALSSPAQPEGPKEDVPLLTGPIADACHKCRNREFCWRGLDEWCHGGSPAVRCEASDLRDLHIGNTPGLPDRAANAEGPKEGEKR